MPDNRGLTKVILGGILAVLLLLSLNGESASGYTQEAHLTADDAISFDMFGTSVSNDQETIVIGAPNHSSAGSNSGTAYVFVRGKNAWVQQAKLLASDISQEDRFGRSVSVDGDLIVVGSPYDDGAGGNAGSAYVFVRSSGIWTQQAELFASDANTAAHFGTAVSIDGDMIAVGAPFDDENGINAGSVYVFVRAGNGWVQQAKLTASDARTEDNFGMSVSISGNILAVGSPGNDEGASNSGSIYVYNRDGSGWTEEAELNASDPQEGGILGGSVWINGNTVVAGSQLDNDNGPDSGSAYVFVHEGDSWSQQAKLTAVDAKAGDNFGISVAVSGDAALIGASGNDSAGSNSGAAYVFVRSGDTWTQQAQLASPDADPGDSFGLPVSIRDDIAVVGARLSDENGVNSGSVHVFELDLPPIANGSEDQELSQPPIADAGNDQTLEWVTGGVSATLDGSASSDADGDSLTYIWEGPFTEGNGMIEGVVPSITLQEPGSFEIQLTIEDGTGASDSDFVMIHALDTKAPDVKAAFDTVGKIRDDKGRFRIEYSCSDAGDQSPSILSAALNGTPVDNRDMVKLELDDDVEIKRDDGVLKMEAPSFELVVTCEDASGNLMVVTAVPSFSDSEGKEYDVDRGEDGKWKKLLRRMKSRLFGDGNEDDSSRGHVFRNVLTACSQLSNKLKLLF